MSQTPDRIKEQAADRLAVQKTQDPEAAVYLLQTFMANNQKICADPHVSWVAKRNFTPRGSLTLDVSHGLLENRIIFIQSVLNGLSSIPGNILPSA
jgi:hypothetical protein